jgi:hypothetical protein
MYRLVKTVLRAFLMAAILVSSLAFQPGNAPSTLPTRFPDAPRIVAFGDVHGDLDVTRRALRLAGAIDKHDRWIGGNLVVVQTGDQIDRGDHEQEILDLLVRLAKEAAEAGGALHVLNGNHELMNAEFDFRYVTPKGFADFKDAVTKDAIDSVPDSVPKAERARVAAFRPGGVYARVLGERNSIVIIGPNVFVHGGLLPSHVDYGIERFNSDVRSWLDGEAQRPDLVDSRSGPTWLRLYSENPDTAACDSLGVVLVRLHARRMIVGHTVQESGITPFCDGRVWCIDTGLSVYYGGKLQVLEIVGDSVRVLTGK